MARRLCIGRTPGQEPQAHMRLRVHLLRFRFRPIRKSQMWIRALFEKKLLTLERRRMRVNVLRTSGVGGMAYFAHTNEVSLQVIARL